MTDEREDLEHGREAMVHALLQEQLAPAADPQGLVARFAAGDGARAAERLAVAAAENGRRGVLARWPLWLAAAALLVVSLVYLDSRAGPADDGDRREAVDPAPVEAPQDPVFVETIEDIEALMKLLTDVRSVSLEVLTLPDNDLVGNVDVAGVPVHATEQDMVRLVSGMMRGMGQVEPAGASWQNRLRFTLDDDRVLETAIYPYEQGDRVRLHVRGMQKDISVGVAGSRRIRELLDTATTVARIAHGVVLEAKELTEFPVILEELRLFRLVDGELEALARFTKLRQLDCSGLRKTLGASGLQAITRSCPELRELTLDGVAFSDDDVRYLLDLRRLERLSLRSVRGFSGEGFRHHSLSSQRRAGPLRIDLSYVDSLTDAGLGRICEWDPQELVLRGSRGKITPDGFRALEKTGRLEHLDIRDWLIEDEGMLSVILALQKREGFTLLR